jgi:hypothetical protein
MLAALGPLDEQPYSPEPDGHRVRDVRTGHRPTYLTNHHVSALEAVAVSDPQVVISDSKLRWLEPAVRSSLCRS